MKIGDMSIEISPGAWIVGKDYFHISKVDYDYFSFSLKLHEKNHFPLLFEHCLWLCSLCDFINGL